MADPFSIATGALAVITAAQATGAAIYKGDSVAATKDCLPDALQTQVQNMLASCTTTIQQIERIVAKCREKPGPLRWTIFEKENVATLKVTLEAFKSGLGLVLETVNLSLTREIKNNTEAIQDITPKDKSPTTRSPPLDKFGKQERLGDETASRPLAPPSLDTTPIETGESGSSENHNIAPIAFEAGLVGSGCRGYQLRNARACGLDLIPHKIVASVPCSSLAVNASYCAEAGVWAVLHKDSVLRFWSSHSGELIQSLKVLRKDYRDPDANVEMPDGRFTTIEFCPVNPELIFIQAQNRKIEVWNWRECLRITIAKKARKVFTTCPVSFAPQSTLMYAIDDHGTVTMADLSIPLEPLAPFTLQRDGSTYLYALFLSNTEIWTLHTRKGRLAGRIARIIPLPSLSEVINYQQAPIVATRCETFPLRYGFPYQFGNAIPVVDYKR
ncbi:hypothetical protein NUW58_g5854 [Xylaria curta]|uniref:Uncharacterized protein n=1 Tax=Xylaria curta TaxID=42375 RepID=A0ACC1P1U1_9PEZI|nr:hypothetical protein NUW58_g5854 [Xylaria curta]